MAQERNVEDETVVRQQLRGVASLEVDQTASWRLGVEWHGNDGQGERASLVPREPNPVARRVRELAKCVWNCGPLVLITGAFMMSVVTLGVRLLRNRIPVFQLVALRSSVACVLLLMWSRFLHVSPFGPKGLWPLLAARGTTGALAMSMIFSSLYLIPLADTVVLSQSHPAWTAAASWALQLEPINCMIISGILSCMSGVVLVAHPPFLFGTQSKWSLGRTGGVCMGLLASLFSTCSYLLVSKIGTGAKSISITLWFQGCTLLLSLPLMLANFPSSMVWSLHLSDIALLGLVCFGSVTGQICLNRGLQIVSPAKGTIMLTTQMLFATLLGFLLLNESVSLVGASGLVLIILGVVLVSKGNEVIESVKEIALEDVSRWSWEGLATVLSRRSDEARDAPLTDGERMALLFG